MGNFETIADQVNNMSSEQYLAFIEMVHGVLPDEINEMTDDELLAELGV